MDAQVRALTCGFSVAKYGPQQSTDPYDGDCGNGVNTSGQYWDPTAWDPPAVRAAQVRPPR